MVTFLLCPHLAERERERERERDRDRETERERERERETERERERESVLVPSSPCMHACKVTSIESDSVGPSEKVLVTHCSTLAWKIPWTEEPGRLQSRGLDMTERLHFHFSLLCIGEGNGNPLQCSCLENPRDGVAQSRTRLT